jgi:hypothetical protein
MDDKLEGHQKERTKITKRQRWQTLKKTKDHYF